LHCFNVLMDLQPVDIKSWCRDNWKSAQVVHSHLVCDATIQQPGFDLPRQQWSLLNRFRTVQGHCGACRRKWRLTETDLCPCGKTQLMFHIVKSCPLTKLEWRRISTTLCWWRRCFVADQLWFMACIREEEEECSCSHIIEHVRYHIYWVTITVSEKLFMPVSEMTTVDYGAWLCHKILICVKVCQNINILVVLWSIYWICLNIN